MKKSNIVRGRIEQHSAGFGTPNQEAVMKRAREIAITNGRRAEQWNQADIDQAREELRGAQNAPAESFEQNEEVVPRDGPFVSAGAQAPTRAATDEQTLPEDLVGEGVDEAAHDQMVAGNAESRRRDKAFEDQLPG